MPIISEFPIAGPQGKQGPAGPQGKQGPEGKRGPMGPAGPGTGDMLAMVYDPQGKATDVYKYVDDATAGRADLTLSNLSNYQKALAAIGGKPRDNLLDNAYFKGGGSQQGGGQLPINQRGETSYVFSAGTNYFICRWRMMSGATANLTDGGLQFTGPSGIAPWFQQATPLFEADYRGKTFTASVLITDNELYIATFIWNGSTIDTVISGFGRLRAQTLSTDKLGLTVYPNADVNKTYVAAKLELGDHQTLAYQDEDGNWQLFETPDYAEELAKCQRYYEQTYWSVFYAVANSASQIDYVGTLVLKTEKRIAPTSTVNPNPLQNLSVQDASNGFTPVSGCALQIPTAYNRNMIAPRVTGNFTIGHIYRITIPDNAYIISAEL